MLDNSENIIPEINNNENIAPALYLIPVGLSDAPLLRVLPTYNLQIIRHIRHYVVENVRTARRFLKRCYPDIDINGLTFSVLNTHTDFKDTAILEAMLEPLKQGEAVGLMSEAGCPAVADPGSALVAMAHKRGLRVEPLVGPSSILMSLMASGFNGQGFAFNGYLPIDSRERTEKIRQLENLAVRKNMTQIFIETPYRNCKMLEALCDTLRPDTGLCVAVAITDPQQEFIRTALVAEWRHNKIELTKQPAIFLIGKIGF